MKAISSRFVLICCLLCLVLAAGCFERFNQHKNAEAEADKPATEEKSPETATTKPAETTSGAAGKEEPGKKEEAPAEAAPAEEKKDGGDEEVQLIQFTPEQLQKYGVKVLPAGPGRLDQTLTLPGEVAVNADKVGHVLPRLGGVIQRLTKNIGDPVKQGELLAVLDSRDLAEAKSTYLTAVEQVKVAQASRDREKQLFDKGVSAEQDYIAAQNVVTQAQITQRAAEQTLSALGVTPKQLASMKNAPGASLTRYELFAPTSGRVLEKHVSIGEMVGTETELYLIADLSTVWVNLSVGQKLLPKVKEGQTVHIRFAPEASADAKPGSSAADEERSPGVAARIKYIDALVAEDTRSATARVVLPNPTGSWRPGMFVSGVLTTGDSIVSVVVPLTAIIPYEGNPTVFVDTGGGFEPRTVTLGRQSATHVEVLSGLKAGDKFVSDGAFMVKADLGKSEASGD